MKDMSKMAEERRVYERYVENLRYQASMFQSTYVAGELDGIKRGRKEGKEEGKTDVAINLLDILDDEVISEKTGLSLENVKQLRNKKTL